MAKFIKHEYTAPAHWASYLINNDPSGLDDEDVELADRMIEDIGLGWPVDVSEPEFRHRSDYGPRLAGDISTYVFLEAK